MTNTKQTPTRRQRAEEIREAASEITRNASLLWANPTQAQIGRILMELRHDLQDALKHVEALEASNA